MVKRIFVMGMALAGLVVGCASGEGEVPGGEQGPSVVASDKPIEAVVDPQVNGNGQCCWGHCNASNAFVKVNVTQNCRDRIVDSCHNAGLAFNPNGDAWWGTCP